MCVREESESARESGGERARENEKERERARERERGEERRERERREGEREHTSKRGAEQMCAETTTLPMLSISLYLRPPPPPLSLSRETENVLLSPLTLECSRYTIKRNTYYQSTIYFEAHRYTLLECSRCTIKRNTYYQSTTYFEVQPSHFSGGPGCQNTASVTAAGRIP